MFIDKEIFFEKSQFKIKILLNPKKKFMLLERSMREYFFWNQTPKIQNATRI